MHDLYVDMYASSDQANEDSALFSWDGASIGFTGGRLLANNGHWIGTYNRTRTPSGYQYDMPSYNYVYADNRTFGAIDYVTFTLSSDSYAIFTGEANCYTYMYTYVHAYAHICILITPNHQVRT